VFTPNPAGAYLFRGEGDLGLLLQMASPTEAALMYWEDSIKIELTGNLVERAAGKSQYTAHGHQRCEAHRNQVRHL
jgi:hypothetical protein